MAEPAYRVIDRRGQANGGANWMIDSARPNLDRQRIPLQDRDFHRNITAYGRRTLMSIGRWMFYNIPALRGAILEQANLAVSSFLPQYFGADKVWGDEAENWLFNWHKIFDVAGPPMNRRTWLRFLILSQFTDGDMGTLLTGVPAGRDPLGYPMIQIIPAHRIRSQDNNAEGGEFDGARIIDGVIVNDYGRALAYRVYNEGASTMGVAADDYRDIAARDMFLTFDPDATGQVRGLPLLLSSVFNFQDSAEFDRFEMLAQKAFSAHTLVETNETGETDQAKAIIRKKASFDSDNQKTAPDEQEIGGGLYRYFKANTGSKLEPFAWDRPSGAAQAFQNRKIRDAFRGTEWDAFFSLDPEQVGGAPMRVIVEKINTVLEKRRAVLAEASARVDGYGLSKAIKLGDVRENVDWFKWEYQGPGDVTADRKYDSDVDVQEVGQGFSTRKIAAGRRGQYWEDLDAQRELEADSDLERASRLVKNAKARGDVITIQEALVILRPPTPTQQLPSGSQPQKDPKAAKDKTE